MKKTEFLRVEDMTVEVRQGVSWVKVVDRLRVTLDRERVLGVVGESGCGKTMAALALTRLIPARVGRVSAKAVWFDKENLAAASEQRVRQVRGKDITYVFQEPSTSLNPVMTIEAQLREVLTMHRGDVPLKNVREMITEQMERVGIRSPAAKLAAYPHQLSGGEKQRAMIAMALLARPRLLIADEPTTALDVTIQAQILALLRQVVREYKVGLMFISHDMSVVAELADSIAVMYAGQVVERAAAEQVVSAPRHPYTQGLIASLPERAHAERLQPINGDVPRPGEWPVGCRFHPRCPKAFARCRAEEPPVFPMDNDEEVRCWLYSPSKT